MKQFDFNWLNDAIEEAIDNIVSTVQDVQDGFSEGESLDKEELMNMIEDLWAQHLEITAEELNDRVGEYAMKRIKEALNI